MRIYIMYMVMYMLSRPHTAPRTPSVRQPSQLRTLAAERASSYERAWAKNEYDMHVLYCVYIYIYIHVYVCMYV